jgi:hypothetical protein
MRTRAKAGRAAGNFLKEASCDCCQLAPVQPFFEALPAIFLKGHH